jgi:hypothetical protein
MRAPQRWQQHAGPEGAADAARAARQQPRTRREQGASDPSCLIRVGLSNSPQRATAGALVRCGSGHSESSLSKPTLSDTACPRDLPKPSHLCPIHVFLRPGLPATRPVQRQRPAHCAGGGTGRGAARWRTHSLSPRFGPSAHAALARPLLRSAVARPEPSRAAAAS